MCDQIKVKVTKNSILYRGKPRTSASDPFYMPRELALKMLHNGAHIEIVTDEIIDDEEAIDNKEIIDTEEIIDKEESTDDEEIIDTEEIIDKEEKPKKKRRKKK